MIEIPKQLQLNELKFILLKTKDKTPLEKWQEKNYSFNDPILQKHLENNYNYGLKCGSGLIIIDADTNKLKTIVEKQLPTTFTVKSGKGYHYYYFCMSFLKKKVLKDKNEHLGEIQSNGTYIVAPNSIHPNGHTYLVHNDVEITTIEEEEINKVLEQYYSSERTNYKELILKGSKQGLRNESMFKLACSFRTQKLSIEETYSTLQNINEKNNPPLSNYELKTVIESAYKYENKDFDEIALIQNEKNTYIDAESLMQLNIPEIEWFVNNIIPKRGVTIIGGDSGSLKSFLSLHLSTAMSSKKLFLSQFHIQEEEGDIIYIDEENRINTLKKRLTLLKNGYTNSDFSNVKLIIESGLKLDQAIERKRLEEDINKREYKPKLIIFDSFVRFFLGDENFSGDVKKVFEQIKILMKTYDCAIILLHHTSKNTHATKHSLRGSGDLSAFADVVLMMEHKKRFNNYILSQVKNRHDEETTPIKIKLEANKDNIKILFDGFLEENNTKQGQCLVDLEDWIRKNKITEFKKWQAKDQLKPKGYSESQITLAMSSAIGKIIEKIDRGEYKVIQEDISFFEEEKIQ